MCIECYSDNDRITPLLKPLECLRNHTQYICGTCGRCICIEPDPRRGLYRWSFPFKSPDIAKLYLRTADVVRKMSCGIYAIQNENGRISFKIFANQNELREYLEKNRGKTCDPLQPLFQEPDYKEYPCTEIRKLTQQEIDRYMAERQRLR